MVEGVAIGRSPPKGPTKSEVIAHNLLSYYLWCKDYHQKVSFSSLVCSFEKLCSLFKIPTVGGISQKFTQISLASQPNKSSCESPHHVKCLFCPSIMVSSQCEMLVLPFNHVAMDVRWVKHSTIGNDWVWFGPNSLFKIPTVGKISQKFMQISLASQPNNWLIDW